MRTHCQMTRRKRIATKIRHSGERTKIKSSWSSLVLPGVIALLAVLAMLFPGKTRTLVESLSELMGKGIAFEEVFSSLGRAVGGEDSFGSSLQDAYTAVFNPSENDVQEDAEIDTESTMTDTGVENEIQVCTSPAFPDNASLDYRILGFRYTTPVAGVLTSTFGWRIRSGENITTFHYGVDIAAPEGTEIVAFADGEVFASGESSTLGKYIVLRHAGGYSTLYAHCSEILISAGTVHIGEPIARVGDTGSATGAHLHFELQNETLYLNPLYYVAIW